MARSRRVAMLTISIVLFTAIQLLVWTGVWPQYAGHNVVPLQLEQQHAEDSKVEKEATRAAGDAGKEFAVPTEHDSLLQAAACLGQIDGGNQSHRQSYVPTIPHVAPMNVPFPAEVFHSGRPPVVPDGSSRRYLLLLSAREGLASQRRMLPQVVYLARSLELTLVEPCMVDSRMTGVCKLHPRGKPLRAYFDWDRIGKLCNTTTELEFWQDPDIRPQGARDLVNATGVCMGMKGRMNITEMGLSGGSCTDDAFLQNKTRWEFQSVGLRLSMVPHCARSWNAFGLPKLRAAIREAKVVVLFRMWKYSFTIPSEEREAISREIAFNPHLERYALSFASTVVGRPYIAFNWRSEEVNPSVMHECASTLQRVVKSYSRSRPDAGLVLISDLTFPVPGGAGASWNVYNDWNSTERRDAVQLLMNGPPRLVKYDSWCSPEDAGMRSVIEYYLAVNADVFITCTTNSPICRKCTRWHSTYADVIISARRALGAKNTTHTVWRTQNSLTRGYRDPPNTPDQPTQGITTDTTIEVLWNPLKRWEHNGAPVSGYILDFSEDFDTTSFRTVFRGMKTRFTVTKLTPDTTYTFRVTAVNDVGYSQPSIASSLSTTGSSVHGQCGEGDLHL